MTDLGADAGIVYLCEPYGRLVSDGIMINLQLPFYEGKFRLIFKLYKLHVDRIESLDLLKFSPH